MSQWSKSSYHGPIENGWEEGEGQFTFPNGVKYEGEFNKGEFHGNGTLIYPNGGRYVAKWDRGKLISGEYFFYDNLKFQDKEWNYCTIQDRRFYTEQLKGLRPDGKTLICNDINGPKNIHEGTYDIGDGFYDPTKRIICNYKGEFKRDLEKDEEQWITEKCRYNARQFEEQNNHLDGAEDKIIQEMIKLNNPDKVDTNDLKF